MTPDLSAFYTEDENGCWLWAGVIRGTGYGSWCGGNAHRIVFEIFNGPLAKDEHLDHLCRVRACVNPSHLEPVTNAENIRRGESPAGLNAQKTHCHRGHDLSGDNLRIYGGKRQCRTCHTLRAQKQRAHEKSPRLTAVSDNTD